MLPSAWAWLLIILALAAVYNSSRVFGSVETNLSWTHAVHLETGSEGQYAYVRRVSDYARARACTFSTLITLGMPKERASTAP